MNYLFACGCICLLQLSGCASQASSRPELVTADSGLAYVVVAQGDGESAEWGDTVVIHESTAHLDGTMIFSTFTINSPISFTLGADQVVDGMEELVVGMRIGERRQAVMPPLITKRERYPQGRDGQPPVFGPDDTLRFEVELVSVEKSKQG